MPYYNYTKFIYSVENKAYSHIVTNFLCLIPDNYVGIIDMPVSKKLENGKVVDLKAEDIRRCRELKLKFEYPSIAIRRCQGAVRSFLRKRNNIVCKQSELQPDLWKLVLGYL